MSRKIARAYKRIYEGANYRLRTLAGGIFASHCRPTTIALLLTELCNARCVHCDIWKNKGREESPTIEQWSKFLRDLRRWLGPVQITFTGGEALLRPFTIDLVRYAASLGFLVEHLTHGYWDDQSKIERLALANPWRVTVSVDGIGETHTRIRGRDKFFEKTLSTIHTLSRVRKERSLDFALLLKTVVMEHNLEGVCDVARFARQNGAQVWYQPIEQNYNTPEDPRWFEHSDNWPKDSSKAVAVVEQLIQMKRDGFPIANGFHQLEVMIPYFRDPQKTLLTTRSHTAHERLALCAALTMLQVQANGDVRDCARSQPVGNIKDTPIRQIWERRPHVWEEGCCLLRRPS
ncbi:MAG: radical SAM protein [Acidobacteriia bacterium]|nr:radical SAM protein [Terriglobia bacterium]